MRELKINLEKSFLSNQRKPMNLNLNKRDKFMNLQMKTSKRLINFNKNTMLRRKLQSKN